jgi:hypothetical protein
VAFSLPAANPPSSLEGRIVERFRIATGRAPAPSRRRLLVLIAATLTAGLLALGSFGWAVAERGRAQTAEEKKAQVQQQVKEIAGLSDKLTKSLNGRGRVLTATLQAPAGDHGFGTAFIFTVPKSEDILFVDVAVLPDGRGPFIIQLVDGRQAINAGPLKMTAGGHLVTSPIWFTQQNLGGVVTVTVIDSKTGAVALTGTVQPYSG